MTYVFIKFLHTPYSGSLFWCLSQRRKREIVIWDLATLPQSVTCRERFGLVAVDTRRVETADCPLTAKRRNREKDQHSRMAIILSKRTAPLLFLPYSAAYQVPQEYGIEMYGHSNLCSAERGINRSKVSKYSQASSSASCSLPQAMCRHMCQPSLGKQPSRVRT